MIAVLGWAIIAALVGLAGYVAGWMKGRKLLGTDAGCLHCECNCPPDCSTCVDLTATEILTGKAS